MKVLPRSALAGLIRLSLSFQGVSDVIAVAGILSFEVFGSSLVAKGTLVLRGQLMKGISEGLKPPRSKFKGLFLHLCTHANLFHSVFMRFNVPLV